MVGFEGQRSILMTLRDPQGVAAGDRVRSAANLQFVPVGRRLLGRVIDGLGQPIDGKGPVVVESHNPVYREAPQALTRRPVEDPLYTGIRAIDAMHTSVAASGWASSRAPGSARAC